MTTTQSSIIDGLRDALISAGYKVFDSILDRHTGYATKSSTYVMIDRSMTFDWNEVTDECIDSPFTLRMRYYQGTSKVQNSNGEMIGTSTACCNLERSISQVKVPTMWTRFNMTVDNTIASNLRGFTRDYVLNGNLTAKQDKCEFIPPYFENSPTISGGDTVGGTSTMVDGVYGGNPIPTLTRGWRRDGVVIAGETGSTYTKVAADAGTITTGFNKIESSEGEAEANSNGIYVNPSTNALTVDSTLYTVDSTLITADQTEI